MALVRPRPAPPAASGAGCRRHGQSLGSAAGRPDRAVPIAVDDRWGDVVGLGADKLRNEDGAHGDVSEDRK